MHVQSDYIFAFPNGVSSRPKNSQQHSRYKSISSHLGKLELTERSQSPRQVGYSGAELDLHWYDSRDSQALLQSHEPRQELRVE